MKKVLLVFGTRPEAIKMCPLVNELRRRPDQFDVSVCVTGQHRQMLDMVLRTFSVVPEYDLDIMSANQTLYDVTTNVLMGMKDVLAASKPDVVLVHGDTTTSFAAGLSAFYEQIPIGHVEAGLRTYNIMSPYPEEFNRQAVDAFTSYYFAPTTTARDHLLAEGHKEDGIWVTGNTGIDALATTVRDSYQHEVLDWAQGSRLLLITAHRRENLGEPMHHMFKAIRRIVETHDDVKAVYPVHLNPRVRRVADEELNGCDRIKLIEPMEVLDFHNILARCYVVLTDSGGIQEEAPGLGKPVLVMRDTTERPEGVAAGTLRLVGTGEESIFSACCELLDDDSAYQAMSLASNPYGDGHASERIADILEKY